jgi:putative acetyltransferase
MKIEVDDLRGPEVAAFLRAHLDDLFSIVPPESRHALDLDGLRHPDITFWTMRDGDTLVATGALKELDPGHGEVKSMRTAPSHRRQGVGSAMLAHIEAEARLRGYIRLSLETGSFPFFERARLLYRKHGFEPCGPFADYTDDPNAAFMTKVL